MRRSALLPLLVFACSNATPPERYGFVTTLGNDTVSVERVERTPSRLVTDGVDRWPFVRRRHTEFDLNPDGTIRHMVMDVGTPDGRTPAERGRRVTADFSRDRVTISVQDSGGVRDTAFATGGAITVPHVSMMYSVIELISRPRSGGRPPPDSRRATAYSSASSTPTGTRARALSCTGATSIPDPAARSSCGTIGWRARAT